MGFSCTIKAGSKDLTMRESGAIHSQLLNLGPNGSSATEAPYRVSDFRNVVSNCTYGDRLKDAAQDCFRELQRMARANLESLRKDPHCETCTCFMGEIEPNGWSKESIETLLEIDPESITHVSGGY